MNKTIIYIGGYQSSGHKASVFKEKIQHEIEIFAPDYDNEDPVEIRKGISQAIQKAQAKNNTVEIIGSSTGGMTALLLQPFFNFKMYLINPLLSKEQFFDQDHPVGPQLSGLSAILLNQEYLENSIKIYLGLNDELLNPQYTKDFASNKNIEVIEFEGNHAGEESLEMIIEEINKN